jgi:hypothetical protein
VLQQLSLARQDDCIMIESLVSENGYFNQAADSEEPELTFGCQFYAG